MDLETIARRLPDGGEVSRGVVGLGHSALEVVDIAIDRSVGYCSRLVLLRDSVKLFRLCCVVLGSYVYFVCAPAWPRISIVQSQRWDHMRRVHPRESLHPAY